MRMPSARIPVSARQAERYDTQVPLRLEQGGGMVRNVSASGLYFVTDVPLEEGKPMKLTFEFQSLPSGSIQVNCMARVVRLEDQGEMTGVAASIDSFEFIRLPLPGSARR